MLTAVAFLPAPPLLVPELAGDAASATAGLRDASLRAVASLVAEPGPWTAVAAHDVDLQLGPRTAGTWRSFGADVGVSLSPDARRFDEQELPLAALVAGWVRGRAAPASSLCLRLFRADTPPARCVQLGSALAHDPRRQALLVLGDGCTTLTEKAPGAYDPRAATLQQQIDDALSTADTAALGRLDPQLCAELGVSGRVPWQIAAAAAGAGWHGRSLHRSAPYGVGYQVAVWRR